jgi:hypothetical protein
MSLGLGSGAAFAQRVGVATSNPGSLYYSIGSAVANAANAGDLKATIQPATSPTQYVPYVGSGGIEFGVSNLQEVTYGLEGKAWFNGHASPDVRIVGLLMPVREAIFVRADSDIKTIADLRGKRMVDGYTAQKTILPQLDAIYATAGLTRDDVEPVQVTSVVAGANAFMAGQVNGFIFAQGAGKVREADAAVGGLRALPIDNTPENIAAIKKHWPTGYLTEIEPGANTPGVEAANHYIAYPLVVFTHKNVPQDVAYEMAKALYEHKQVMAEAFAPFKLFDPEKMYGDVDPAAFHPGALKFYREVGQLK